MNGYKNKEYFLLNIDTKTASVILAAGRGSRMKGYEGNKTILPLIQGHSPYEGSRPILINIIDSLPSGPKSVVVNYKKEDVMDVTHNLGIIYCEQPVLNGTGGGLLAARRFLEGLPCNQVIITMGDVPFVKRSTYKTLVKNLANSNLVVLGFRPKSKKQYGILEVEREKVRRIIEWKYWKSFTEDKQQSYRICNSGIYAAKKDDLLKYLSVLASRPHIVHKEINGKLKEVEEFFVTDLVEYMNDDGLTVSFVEAAHEEEVMGIDDLNALKKAREIFRYRML